MREVDVDALVRLDHREHLLDRAEHPEAEEVHLHDAEVGAVVLVPLDDDAPLHRRGLERDDLVEPSHRHDHPARVLPEVARQVLDAHEELPKCATRGSRGRSRRPPSRPRGRAAPSRYSPKLHVPRCFAIVSTCSGEKPSAFAISRAAERSRYVMTFAVIAAPSAPYVS